jgi:predicted CXXCH cytochrome family protein
MIHVKYKYYLIIFINVSVCLLLTSCAQKSLADENAIDARVTKTENEKPNSDQNNYIRNTKVRVNPHWDKEKCNVCHRGAPSKDNTNLLNRDKQMLCIECHKDDLTHKYIHPVGIKSPLLLSKKIQDKWKSGMRLDSDKKMTCLTCHDLLNQCLPGRSYMKNFDQNFLREGPYSKRTAICYKCHDSSKYKKYNPHNQISEDGTIKLKKCRLCHLVSSKQKKINKGIKRDVDKYPIIKKLEYDRTLLCIRCHKKIDHPTSAFKVVSMNTYRHLIPITDEKRNTLDSIQKETNVILPLEPETNRIYCATCHEPHEIGVFAGDNMKLTKLHKNRLRVSDICRYCHDK